MSVAFRRESDEEHREPRFELPIPPGPNLVTPRGRALIDTQVTALEAQLAALINDGAVEDSIAALRRDLRYWQTRQVTAQPAPEPDGHTAQIGTTVTLRLHGKPRTLIIVGHDEAEPAADRIAFSAPLARAVLGGEPGETFAFGGKEDAIELLSIAITAS